jgi:serine/threonine protein phosphatase 1
VTRVYAIGDVHGRLDELIEAHRRIAADRRGTGDLDAPVVHLGDLVDRGPESAEVVEYLLMGLAAGEPWVTLRGNHDAMFLLFLGDAQARDPGLRSDLTWLDPRLGGRQTLASYGVDVSDRRAVQAIADEARARVPVGHQEFLEALPLFHETTDAIFVHAGLRPGVPLARQAPVDLTWIRRGFLDDRTDHGRLVVHGHTVVDLPEHHGNRVNIDTGAGYGRPLTAVVVEGRDVWVLTEAGRVPLRPA